MSTYTLTLPSRAGQLDVRIYVDYGVDTAAAYGIALDDNANVRAETDSSRYSGYCAAEIVYHEAHRLIAGRWGVESEDIAAAVESILPPCECED